MNNPFDFFKELLNQPIHIVVWVCFMMFMFVAAIFFWKLVVAKVIFITFILSAGLMMYLYSAYGYEKILGLGHILWIPLIIYILFMIKLQKGLFKLYLLVLVLTMAASLVFDIRDVITYFSSTK